MKLTATKFSEHMWFLLKTLVLQNIFTSFAVT